MWNTIRDMPTFERPRERLKEFGVESLSAQELLQIIMGQGSGAGSVAHLSQRIIDRFKMLSGVGEAALNDLMSIPGVGFSKACQIKAALEMGKRAYSEEAIPKSGSILDSESAYRLAEKYLMHKKKEHLLLFCLDARKRLLAEPEVISVGIVDCSLVHPREVFKTAISNHSSAILLAHNHPSGSSQPSLPDIEVTKQIYEAGKIMGIQLLDHIVVGSKEFTSIGQLNPEIFN